MQLVIHADGSLHCVYSEEINLADLGQLSISRASHVEPDPHGGWLADLALVNGPTLGPFTHRSQALAAEQTWLESNWLSRAA